MGIREQPSPEAGDRRDTQILDVHHGPSPSLPHPVSLDDARLRSRVQARAGETAECSHAVACRTGKMVASRVPGGALLVRMVENLVPVSVRSWWEVVMAAVVDSQSDCRSFYKCSFSLDD